MQLYAILHHIASKLDYMFFAKLDYICFLVLQLRAIV